MNLGELVRYVVTHDDVLGDSKLVVKALVICASTGIQFDISKIQELNAAYDKEETAFSQALRNVELAKQKAIDLQVEGLAQKVAEILDRNLAVELPNGKLVKFSDSPSWECQLPKGESKHRVVGPAHGSRMNLQFGFPETCRYFGKMILDGLLQIDNESGRNKLCDLYLQAKRGTGIRISCRSTPESCNHFGRCAHLELRVVKRQ